MIAIVIFWGIGQSFNNEDPRKALLDADLEKISSNVKNESDTLASKLKNYFVEFANEEINPSNFDFGTKKTNNNLLILSKMPTLKNILKEQRSEVIEMIEMIIDSDTSLIDLDKYIGIKGEEHMMIIKTPDVYKNKSFVYYKELYEFYGAKEDFLE